MSLNPVLTAGSLSVRLAPQVGGSIAGFTWQEDRRTVHLLRPAPAGFTEVRHAGCFPLVPYSNRIREGRFRFRGRTIALPANMPGQRHPLHGLGWRSPWEVSGTDHDSAELVFEYPGGDWPWPFEARQVFRIDPVGLSVTLSVTNRSTDPMPAGLGFHPYFLCNPQTRLQAKTRSVWLVDDEILPTQCVPVHGRYRLQDRVVHEQAIDNGYAGWDGSARIDWGQAQLCMRSPSTDFLQVFSPTVGANLYAPPGWGVFAIEPISHANAALNQPETQWQEAGIKLLGQDETATLEMRLEPLIV